MRGCRWGSISVDELTSSISFAVRSRMSLCRWMGRPPLEQLKACCTELAFPQEYIGEMSFGCQPYRRANASLKAPLCRMKPCYSIGRVFNHPDAPFSWAKVAAYFVLSARASKTLFISSSLRFLFSSLTFFRIVSCSAMTAKASLMLLS